MAKAKVNWTRKIYGDGRGWHVGSLVRWKGAYHVCFVDGSGHGSGDSQIRVCSSADLETWTSQIALGAKTIDPNLLPVGDRLLVYGVRLSREEAEGQPEPEYGFTSQQIVAATTDGKTWSQPRRCFVMNHDFWHPVEHEGRYWVACDTVGHTPHASHNSVDLLVSDDGENWQWVSEIIHGTTHSEYRDSTGLEFGVQAPSETSLCFGEDQRLLAVTRARGYCALLSTAQPPYDQWERTLSQESRCYGSAIAQVGRHVLVTGRSFSNEGIRATADQFNEPFSPHDQTQLRTGVFLYEDGDIQLKAVLPSGGDTGYAGILPMGDDHALIAYYSTYESPDGESCVYLSSVLIED